MFSRMWKHLRRRRLVDVLFGYDLFISYRWSDGGVYAKALAAALDEAGLECFLDKEEYAAGDDWKRVGAWTLRRTSYLVLVGSPEALSSGPVLREVRLFAETGRTIFAIDFEETLDPRQTSSRLFDYLTAATLKLEESRECLTRGEPSREILEALRGNFARVRQRKKRLAVVTAAAWLLAVATTIASIAAWRAVRERDAARREARRANSGRLASESERVAPVRPTLSLLLAIAAVDETHREGEPVVASAAEALYRAVGRVSGEPLETGTAPTTHIVISPDGRLAAARDERGAVRLWGLEGGRRPLCTWSHSTTAIAFAPDGGSLLLGTTEGRIGLLSTRDPLRCTAPVIVARLAYPIARLLFSRDGRFLVVRHNRIRSPSGWALMEWKERGGAVIAQWPGERSDAVNAFFDEAGSRLFLPTADDRLCLVPLRPPFSSRCERALDFRGDLYSSVAVSPNGRWLTAGGLNTAALWDLRSPSPQPCGTRKISGSVVAVAASEQHWYVGANAVMEPLLTFALRDDCTPAPVPMAGLDAPVTVLQKDGTAVVGGTERGHVFRASNGILQVFTSVRSPVARVLVSHIASGRIVAAGVNGPMRSWSLGGEGTSQLPGFDGPVEAAEISPDGRWLVAAGGASIRKWDLSWPRADDRFLLDLRGMETYKDGSASADGSTYAAGTSEGRLQVWSLTGEVPRLVRSTDVGASIFPMFVSERGRWVVVQRPHILQLFDVTRDVILPLTVLGEGLTFARFDPSERWLLASEGMPRRTFLWRLGDGPSRPFPIRPAADATFVSADFHRSGQLVAVAWKTRDAGFVDVWELPRRGPPRRMTHGVVIDPVEVRFGGDLLAIGRGAGERSSTAIRIVQKQGNEWRLGKLQHTAGRFAEERAALNGMIALHRESETGARVVTVNGGEIRETSIAVADNFALKSVSAGGKWAVALPFLATSNDPILYIFNRGVWQGAATLAGHATTVTAVAFSRDERYVATGTSDGRLRLYALATPAESVTGTDIGRMGDEGDPDESRSISELFFDRDGRFLISVDASNRLRRNDLDLEVLLSRARRTAGRQLNSEERVTYGLAR